LACQLEKYLLVLQGDSTKVKLEGDLASRGQNASFNGEGDATDSASDGQPIASVTVPQLGFVKVKVFLDKKDLRLGNNFRKSFLHAVEHTCYFVPLVSTAALGPIQKIAPTDKFPDNVLLEYETAVRLVSENRLKIFPVMIGEHDTIPTDGSYQGPPSIPVANF